MAPNGRTIWSSIRYHNIAKVLLQHVEKSLKSISFDFESFDGFFKFLKIFIFMMSAMVFISTFTARCLNISLYIIHSKVMFIDMHLYLLKSAFYNIIGAACTMTVLYYLILSGHY